MNILKKLQRKQIVSIAILFVMGLGIGGYAWWNHRPAAAIDRSMELTADTRAESRLFVAGDVYWGRRMNVWAQESNLKEEYPFAKLDTFQRDKYDTWIANLECPAVPGVDMPIEVESEELKFNCPVAYMPEFAKWFDIVSLANNHTQNQDREKGQDATRKVLDQHNIQHFGGFNPHKQEDVCEVVTVGTRTLVNGEQKEAKMPIAMCGFHGVYYTITDKAIAEISRYAPYMPVIAMPHKGAEYQAVPDDERRELYQKMIDAGADAVIGNHPHWVQPVEAYRGKPIFYSMGNFIFDQEFSAEVMRSAAIDITMSLAAHDVDEATLEKWTKLATSCEDFRDNCLEQIKQQGLQKLPYSFEYDIIGIDTSNRMTKRANLQLYNAILERLNWDKTQPQLQ